MLRMVLIPPRMPVDSKRLPRIRCHCRPSMKSRNSMGFSQRIRERLQGTPPSGNHMKHGIGAIGWHVNHDGNMIFIHFRQTCHFPLAGGVFFLSPLEHEKPEAFPENASSKSMFNALTCMACIVFLILLTFHSKIRARNGLCLPCVRSSRKIPVFTAFAPRHVPHLHLFTFRRGERSRGIPAWRAALAGAGA